jgi:hypothetical protein
MTMAPIGAEKAPYLIALNVLNPGPAAVAALGYYDYVHSEPSESSRQTLRCPFVTTDDRTKLRAYS